MNTLNPRQREAARYIASPLLVLAGAGSGKTSVITRKIAYLVEQCDIPARHIAAVTFTNKAAREMKERVSKLLTGKDGRGLMVSTFHTLGLNILKDEIKLAGLKSGFTIFDAEDAKGLLRDIALKHGTTENDDVAVLQNAISAWKNAMTTPEAAASHAVDQRVLTQAQVYLMYQQFLRAYNAVDFDDLILRPVQLFHDHPEALARWQGKIRYLLVDEYQDTNLCQYELVKQLVGHRGRLTVVGDDDQSIYAWRGARPENLVQLQQDYPSLKVITLEQNYRSTGRILRAANHLIANNPHTFEKSLWSELGPGEEIRVIETRNEDAEGERICTDMLDLHLRKAIPYGDMAILYRGNHQSRLLEMKLQQYQVPYRLSGGTSFFSRNEVKDAMAYLRLLINPNDDAAFLRIVNVPRREIGPSTLEKLGNYAQSRDISLFRAIDELGLEQSLPGAGLERLRRFSHWLQSIGRRCASDAPVPVIRQLFVDIDYDDWIRQNCNTPAQADRRRDNVNALIDQIQMLVEDPREGQEALNLEDAIARLVLRDMLEQREEEQDSGDKVQLMTLHAAKGLEFPHVYIMGLEEDILPHRTSVEEGNVEEERRLMYVGITRARRSLTLTYAATRKQYGEKFSTTTSRFLDELPQDDLQWEGRGDISPEQNEAKGKATFSTLRSLLSDL